MNLAETVYWTLIACAIVVVVLAFFGRDAE